MEYAVKTHSKLRKLKELLKGKSRLLIVMQDNPDPDSIASAVALARLANVLADVHCSITHGGTVGRAENRALVRYLDLNLRPSDEIDYKKFDLVAAVDTQPGMGNNCIPLDLVPDIVIDHHPCRSESRRSQLIDVRSRYGATATILLEYLRHAHLKPDTQLATAMLYAIRSDTQDFGREAIKADAEAVGLLFPLANKRMLGEIQRGSVYRTYFNILAIALKNARVYERCIVTSLGQVDNPDIIGEVADLLLRDEDADWVLCSGFFGGKILLSLRTSEQNKNAADIVNSITAGIGTGGGHETYAGGQIPFEKANRRQLNDLEKLILKRFLKALGVAAGDGTKLVQ